MYVFLRRLKLHAFNYAIITYGYFNIWGWDKDHSTQNETAIPNIYTSFAENIKDNYKKLLESGLKRLNKCRFYTLANNCLWRAKTLEYDIDSKIFGLLT